MNSPFTPLELRARRVLREKANAVWCTLSQAGWGEEAALFVQRIEAVALAFGQASENGRKPNEPLYEALVGLWSTLQGPHVPESARALVAEALGEDSPIFSPVDPSGIWADSIDVAVSPLLPGRAATILRVEDPSGSLVLDDEGNLVDDQHSEPADLSSEAAFRAQVRGWLKAVAEKAAEDEEAEAVYMAAYYEE